MRGNNRGAYRSGGGGGGGAGGLDPHNLDYHTDVEIIAPQNDDLLRYQTSDGLWHNLPSTVTLADLDDLANVDTTGKADGDLIQWNQTSGNWEVLTPGGETAKFINFIGLLANRPAAVPGNEGITYFSTDTSEGGTLHESDGSQWVKISKGLTEGVDKGDFDPDSVIGADGSGTPGAVVIGADELLGRAGATDMAGLTKAQVLSIINVTEGAQPTGPLEVNTAGAVMETDYLAQSVLVSVTAETPVPVAFLNGELLGRGASGDLRALTKAEVLSVLNVEDGAQVNLTDQEMLDGIKNVDGPASGLNADLLDDLDSTAFAAAVHTHGEGDITDLTGKYVPNALFDANTLLKANVDNIPTTLVMAEDRIVGRLAGGAIEPLTGADVGSLIALSDLAVPTSNVDMNSKQLENLSPPVNITDAARWEETTKFRDVRPITGLTQTLELIDAGALLRFDNAADQTLTVPPNAQVAFPVGTRIWLHVQSITGDLNVVEGAGVTIDAAQTTLSAHDTAVLMKTVAPNTWDMSTTQNTEEGIPPGGTTGQVLKKISGIDFDVDWQADLQGGAGGTVPDGGATGYHLAKNSANNQDLIWEAPPTFTSPVPLLGTTGQILAKTTNANHDMEWIDDVGATTDLTNTPDADSVTVESTSGTDTDILGASQTLAGMQTAADKTKLDGLDPLAQVPPGGAINTVLKKLSGTNFDTEWGAAAATPLTTKGDLLGYDTGDNRIPVGTDTHVLTADAAEPLGVKWAAAAGGGATNLSHSTDATTVTIESDTGTDTIIPTAGAGQAGILTDVDQTQIQTNKAHVAVVSGNPHAVTAADAGADPAGSAAGVQTNLTTHEGDSANPHSVTAAQTSALALAGGTMTGEIVSRQISYPATDKGNSGTGTITIDPADNGHQKYTVTGNHTLAVANFSEGDEVWLEIIAGGDGTISLSGITEPTDQSVTYETGPNGRNTFVLYHDANKVMMAHVGGSAT